MRLWILHRLDSLRTNYWLLPALMAAVAVVAAVLLPMLDRDVQSRVPEGWGWTYTGGPEGARAVLSTVAGSMITVAGTVFSITIVALTLASGQFGPRLLRNFIRDRGNQFVLGVFTATFIYCLLVLRTVRGTDHHLFVPSMSVTVGIALALIDLGVLIYFIHHVAISIQATRVIHIVNQELCQTIDRLWPVELGDEPPGVQPALPQEEARDGSDPVPIAAKASGYVEVIDDEGILRIAQEHDLVVRLMRRPGQFVVKGSPLATIHPADHLKDELRDQINEVFTLGTHRTPFQDVEFAVDQLVEIAVRALSPGINDPFTAMTCIDRLGEALCRLAKRSVPSPYRYDEQQHLRVVTHAADFEGVVDAAFNQIRQYGRSSAGVLIRLLETFAVIANHTDNEASRAALARHAKLVERAAVGGIPEEEDRKDVESRFRAVKAALQKPAAS